MSFKHRTGAVGLFASCFPTALELIRVSHALPVLFESISRPRHPSLITIWPCYLRPPPSLDEPPFLTVLSTRTLSLTLVASSPTIEALIPFLEYSR